MSGEGPRGARRALRFFLQSADLGHFSHFELKILKTYSSSHPRSYLIKILADLSYKFRFSNSQSSLQYTPLPLDYYRTIIIDHSLSFTLN